MMKIDQILMAVRQGCATSLECEALTDIPLKHCSAYLRSLELVGKIRRVGERIFPGSENRTAVEWTPTRPRQDMSKTFAERHPFVVLDGGGEYDSRWSNIQLAVQRAEKVDGAVMIRDGSHPSVLTPEDALSLAQ